MDSSRDEEEVDQELLEWGEAGKIFGLLAGTDEMDEEEQRKTVEGIRLFRQGIVKQIEGLRMQDEGLAIVQEAVAKHPLRALGPLLDAAMVGLREVTTVAAAYPGQHVTGTSSTPIASDPCMSSPTPTPGPSTSSPTPTPGPSTSFPTHTPGPSTSSPTPTHGPSTSTEAAIPSAHDIPSSRWTAIRLNVDGMHKYKCSGCDLVQAMRNAVLSHIRVVHTKTELSPCPHCGKFTSTNSDSY